MPNGSSKFLGSAATRLPLYIPQCFTQGRRARDALRFSFRYGRCTAKVAGLDDSAACVQQDAVRYAVVEARSEVKYMVGHFQPSRTDDGFAGRIRQPLHASRQASRFRLMLSVLLGRNAYAREIRRRIPIRRNAGKYRSRAASTLASHRWPRFRSSCGGGHVTSVAQGSILNHAAP